MNCLEFQTLINIKYLDLLENLKKNNIIDYNIDIKKLKIYIDISENNLNNSLFIKFTKNILDIHKQYFVF
jgi:hypothetical protein